MSLMPTEIAASNVGLDHYAAVVGRPEIEEIRELAARLAGRSIKMVNSTAVGGGSPRS
jgi:alcohol dehydrogenase class IV